MNILSSCPEMSVSNYEYTLCNITEEPRSHLQGGGSLKVSEVTAACACINS